MGVSRPAWFKESIPRQPGLHKETQKKTEEKGEEGEGEREEKRRRGGRAPLAKEKSKWQSMDGRRH